MTKDNQDRSEGQVFTVHNEPVMKAAVDVVGILGNKGKVILQAQGLSIPNAVAVANIITENILNKSCKVEKVTVDSLGPAGIGRLVSTIEIVLVKNQ